MYSSFRISDVALPLLVLVLPIESQPRQGQPASLGEGLVELQLVDASLEAGVSGAYVAGNSHTGGAAWVDYNGDLLPDLFVSNGSGYDHYLFRNQGGGSFVDVSFLVPKPDVLIEDAGVKYADLENDGDLDILVPVDNPSQVVAGAPVNPPCGGPNLLYVNQGDGTFVEAAASYGLLHPLGRRTSDAGFADWDNDGFIDLYLASWTPYGLPLGVNDDFDRLLRNNGDGSFADVTNAYGVDGYGLDGLIVLWFDGNFDRFPDLYVANVAIKNAPPAFVPIDAYYQNLGGTAFVDQIPGAAGIGDDSLAAMGMDVGDIDNDGDWDLYITDLEYTPPAPLGNPLYLGNPDGSFDENSADAAGVEGIRSWPCNFADLDRDGWVDLWVGTLVSINADLVYVNERDGTFRLESLPDLTGNAARGGASADYDGDGDVDFVIVPYLQDMRLYRNDSRVQGGWIEFKLYGTTSNRGAVGAVVRIEAAGVSQMRRVSGGDSAHSQSDAIVHFGVGRAQAVTVTVEWPSGTTQVFPGVTTGDLVLIDEDAGILTESVTDGGSSFDAASRVLHVVLESSYGGRTALRLGDFGDLVYKAETCTHEGLFESLEDAPSALVVHSQRGNSWTLSLSSNGE